MQSPIESMIVHWINLTVDRITDVEIGLVESLVMEYGARVDRLGPLAHPVFHTAMREAPPLLDLTLHLLALVFQRSQASTAL